VKSYDLAVIGAGPAGLFAAVKASNAGLSVCIAEANSRPGLKLLVTGQGKCNITNSVGLPDMLKKYGQREKFVRKCLYAFSADDLTEFFNGCGLRLTERDDGKIFPETESARDVLNCLLNMCTKSDIDIMYNRRISGVSAENGRFGLCTGNGNEPFASASSLLIATGGMSYPSTGSRGDGYLLAEQFGHTIIVPKPALSSLKILPDALHFFRGCAGITVSCSLSLFRDGKKLHSYGTREHGILLYTHTGLSGPVIIDNSRDFRSGDELAVNLIPHLNPEEAGTRLLAFCNSNGKSGIKRFFTEEGVPGRLASAVIDYALSAAESADSGAGLSKSSGDIRCAELSAQNRRKILEAFTALRFSVAGVDGFKKAMCTAGGVDTAEINPSTMESRLQPGLFFAGEVIDVDGDSGGYNLQFAFSSAAAAAKGAAGRNS